MSLKSNLVLYACTPGSMPCAQAWLFDAHAGAIIAVAFVHNLLRRHPACCVLLHRPTPRQAPDQATASAPTENGEGFQEPSSAGPSEGQQDSNAAPGHDPYLPEEEDPAESRAIESSLWEMDSLRNHYAPQVRRAALSAARPLHAFIQDYVHAVACSTQHS
jgi:U3 small nucleolar RNA-associated protein 19